MLKTQISSASDLLQPLLSQDVLLQAVSVQERSAQNAANSSLVIFANRIRMLVKGRVQGVGFRPFVYRLATALQLTGSVQNTIAGVAIEIEGAPQAIEYFQIKLRSELPAPAHIQAIEQQRLVAQGSKRFEIIETQLTEKGRKQTVDSSAIISQILPDLATCSDCLQDISSQHNRRYHYPFTTCTCCGPRFSILSALPYDRAHTTMAGFHLCQSCQTEYGDPQQRRFHAQPIACEQCGPALSFWAAGQRSHQPPLECAIALLKQGKILAMKGLGGFQLLTDACDPDAVNALRQRKGRPDKPLALVLPTLESVRKYCQVSDAAAALLSSPQGPIVLLPKRIQPVTGRIPLAQNIAPNSHLLGVMLPTTPLHHLLLQRHAQPLVATSGNLSGDPICTKGSTARWQLSVVADAFLDHNRPIQRPVDDSVVQLVRSQPQVLRHARGYAPQVIHARPLAADSSSKSWSRPCVLALGAQLKNAIALSTGDTIMLSQHIGDLSAARTLSQLRKTVCDFLSLYRVEPDAIACDQHPDYATTRLAQTLAKERNIPCVGVQHHYAHILSCIAEHQLKGPVLGIAWDGTGYGSDQTIWGGEFLQTTDTRAQRVSHLLPYFLLGGDCCALEPRRSALGLLYGCYGEAAFEMTDLAPMQAFQAPQLIVLRKMLSNKINAPVTSSVGRLFDGVAALLNLRQIISFEGQAAALLESVAYQSPTQLTYPFNISDTQPSLIDWRPMIRAIVQDLHQHVMTPVIAAKFHNTLSKMIVSVARRRGIRQVVLSGGCFQNVRLTEQTIRQLSEAGFSPYWPQQVPTNDGGLAVGQIMAAWRQLPYKRLAHVASADDNSCNTNSRNSYLS